MKDKINSILPYIIIIIVVLLIKKLVVTPIKVNGESMMPTLEEKEIMILNKTAYYFNEPQRFDIVVVETKNEYLIKRIIGLPNEEIEYKDNVLYVNGKRTKEPFAHGKTENFITNSLGSKKIPKDCYIVLGDNRENSLDSRELGFIKKEQLLGKTNLVIFPFNKIKKVK